MTAMPLTAAPNRVILEPKCSSLSKCINKLPTYGTINYDPNSHYWYISLPSQWQQSKNLFAEHVHKSYCSTNWYNESTQLAEYWDKIVNDDNEDKLNKNGNNNNNNTKPPPPQQQQPIIHCVSPPSVVGMYHVSCINDSCFLFVRI